MRLRTVLASGVVALTAAGLGAGSANAADSDHAEANRPATATPNTAVTPNAVGILRGGQILRAGHYLRSPNGRYALLEQTDGNAVVYRVKDKVALWSTQTNGHRGAYLDFQVNGDMVVYDSAHKPLWTSGTGGHADTGLLMQNDSNLVIYTKAKKSLWNWQTNSTELLPGETLTAGHSRLSQNRRYRLTMGRDGNVTLNRGATTLWTTHTQGHAGSTLSMQHNGNVVVHSVKGTTLWQSGTHGKVTELLVQSDGDLVLYNGKSALWSSRTHG